MTRSWENGNMDNAGDPACIANKIAPAQVKNLWSCDALTQALVRCTSSLQKACCLGHVQLHLQFFPKMPMTNLMAFVVTLDLTGCPWLQLPANSSSEPS